MAGKSLKAEHRISRCQAFLWLLWATNVCVQFKGTKHVLSRREIRAMWSMENLLRMKEIRQAAAQS